MARTKAPKILSDYKFNKTASGTPRTSTIKTKLPEFSTTPVKKGSGITPVKSAPTAPGKKVVSKPINNTTMPVSPNPVRSKAVTPGKKATARPIDNAVTPIKGGGNITPVRGTTGKKVVSKPINNTITPVKKGTGITPVKGTTAPVRGGTATPKVSRGTIKPIEGIPVPKNPTPVKAAKKK
jgi:hypothetical protein